MTTIAPSIQIPIDPTNPGQFFACCGILEFADKLWNGVTGWFEGDHFLLSAQCPTSEFTLQNLFTKVSICPMRQREADAEDDTPPPIELGQPFDLVLDWWSDKHAGGSRLKVWAGTMDCYRIAKAMRAAIQFSPSSVRALFDDSKVVFDPDDPNKKVEPFCFDSRRGDNSISLNIGFKTDPLKMKTVAFPAVEFLCLVGLQRARPMPFSKRRVFEYHTWSIPSSVTILPALICGLISEASPRQYRFKNLIRTEKGHKAFSSANFISKSLFEKFH